MRMIIIVLAAALLLPAIAAAQTYPTNGARNRSGISGDINGDVSGTAPKRKQYYYKQDPSTRPGCYRNRNRNYICK